MDASRGSVGTCCSSRSPNKDSFVLGLGCSCSLYISLLILKKILGWKRATAPTFHHRSRSSPNVSLPPLYSCFSSPNCDHNVCVLPCLLQHQPPQVRWWLRPAHPRRRSHHLLLFPPSRQRNPCWSHSHRWNRVWGGEMHCPSPSDLTRTNVWVLMKKKIFFCSCRYVMVTYGRNAYSVVARPDSARHGKDLIIGSSYFFTWLLHKKCQKEDGTWTWLLSSNNINKI